MVGFLSAKIIYGDNTTKIGMINIEDVRAFIWHEEENQMEVVFKTPPPFAIAATRKVHEDGKEEEFVEEEIPTETVYMIQCDKTKFTQIAELFSSLNILHKTTPKKN